MKGKVVSRRNFPDVHKLGSSCGRGEWWNTVNGKTLYKIMKQLLLLMLLLLCSCVTSSKVRDYLAKEKNKPAAEGIVSDWLAQNREWYAQKAARDFPAKETPTPAKESVPVPAQKPVPATPKVSVPRAEAVRAVATRRIAPEVECPDVTFFEKTIGEKELVIQENTARLQAAHTALKREQDAHHHTKQQLRTTEVERDDYKEKNRKKFWGLVAMALFTVLFVLFRLLAARVA
jgi:hypothetical protein